MSEANAGSDKLAVRVYDDVLAPSAQTVGGALAAAVKLALSPATLVIRSLNEAVELAEEGVKERLRRWGTQEERVQSPPPEVAAPALQALRFAHQDAALRELYLNLLAKAMVKGSQDEVHPAFAEVLRQVSPAEARALDRLRSAGHALPLVEVRIYRPSGGWHTLAKHISPLGHHGQERQIVRAAVIDNFARLGLLTVFPMNHLSSSETYSEIESSPEARATLEVIAESGETGHFHRYLAEVTEFGRDFLRAISDEAPKEPDAA